MQLQERSYNTNIFRPKPMIRWEIENQLLMVATNWGARDAAQKILDEVAKYVTAAQGDVEVTTPFEFLPQLTPQANSLRIATLLANELVFRSDNRNEFIAGVELTLILKTKTQLSWLQIGQPHLYFKRKNGDFQPLSVVPDLSFDLLAHHNAISPLPKEMMGTESLLSPQVGHCIVRPGDQLVLLSRSEIPNAFYDSANQVASLQAITENISRQDGEMPFWLGLLDI